MKTRTPILATALSGHDVSTAGLVVEMQKSSALMKTNPLALMWRYLRLVLGPGRLSPDDFLRLRIFDEAFYGGADVGEFVGASRYRTLCYAVNYRHDWLGMLSNKIASMSYLTAYGLPVIPAKAIYAPRTGSAGSGVICDAAALKEFLLSPESYPLFGKPIEGSNSLGSIALVGCVSSTHELLTSIGERVHTEDLIAEIDARYPTGYLFQERAAPHSAITAVCGDRLATVRFLTIIAEDGARVFRACWKLPSGINVADNYWRSGNLLAQIDRESGRIMRVTSGSGSGMREYTVHPDTQSPLVGFVHPQWEEMKALALKGARLMANVPLIGWDIACTDKGPVIVEMNEHPDSFLMQFADRRGIFDDEFKKFLAFQEKNRAAFSASVKARMRH